ncbi:MAG: endonuclease III domain-containing protein [Deltaproteobacteria bacterium]|nr:endonuclease III domain-containing protein [Deltaproteobacteria bacterium]
MISKLLDEIYQRMLSHFGPQKWWPAETPFEMMVGAILTQNTNWKNVEKAIQNLKLHHLMDAQKLYEISPEYLSQMIKPAGYYNLKANRLKNWVRFLIEDYQEDLDKMKNEPLSFLREKMLQVKGVGPETVDSILLYALHFPIFVIDQYTYRILSRHFLISEDAQYDEMQTFMMNSLALDVELFNEYHALIVAVGKNYCKKKPHCELCPLNGFNGHQPPTIEST